MGKWLCCSLQPSFKYCHIWIVGLSGDSCSFSFCYLSKMIDLTPPLLFFWVFFFNTAVRSYMCSSSWKSEWVLFNALNGCTFDKSRGEGCEVTSGTHFKCLFTLWRKTIVTRIRFIYPYNWKYLILNLPSCFFFSFRRLLVQISIIKHSVTLFILLSLKCWETRYTIWKV